MFAFYVWFCEHEFHISITKEFPILKLFNMMDDGNWKEYNEIQKRGSNNNTTSKMTTFGD
jgi:hypothetical protein